MESILKSYEYSLMMEHQELMNAFDVESFKGNCRSMMEGVFDISTITLTAIQTEKEKITMFVNKSLDTLKNVSVDKNKVEDFFSKIYNSTLLGDMPLATPVADISEVEKIRPQYLEQISTDMGDVIGKIFKNTINKDEIKQYCDTDYRDKIKRQMVKTSLPINLKPQDMQTNMSKSIVQISNEFLTTNLLPFLRSLPQLTKEMDVTAINSLSQINRLLDDTRDYVVTAEKLKGDPSCDPSIKRNLDYYLYNVIRIVFDECSYLGYMIIRRINSITFNVMSYNELYTKILNYYPEGDRIIHESVMDGSFRDIDDGIVVQNILNGDASTLMEICNSLLRKQRSDLSYLSGTEVGDDDHSLIDMKLNGYEYSITPYHNTLQMIKQISNSIHGLVENSKDPEMIFDDILKKCGLDNSLSVRYREIIPTISDIENYHSAIAHSQDSESLEDVIMTIVKELKDYNGHIERITDSIHSCNGLIQSVKNEFENNVNGEIQNQQTLNELIKFMDDFEVDFRQFLLTIIHALISRLEGLSHILNEVDKSITDEENRKIQFSQIEKLKDGTDYYESAITNILEGEEIVTQHIFESLLQEYHSLRTFKDRGVRLIYENGEDNSVGFVGESAIIAKSLVTSAALTGAYLGSQHATLSIHKKERDKLNQIEEFYSKNDPSFIKFSKCRLKKGVYTYNNEQIFKGKYNTRGLSEKNWEYEIIWINDKYKKYETYYRIKTMIKIGNIQNDKVWKLINSEYEKISSKNKKEVKESSGILDNEFAAYFAEADRENTTSPKVEVNANQQQENMNQSTAKTTNTQTTGVVKQTIQDVVGNLKEFFGRVINNFKNKIKEQKNPDNENNNVTWLDTHKEALLSRGYQGINVHVLPYSKVNPDTISTEIESVTKRINMLNSSTIAGFKKKEDMQNFLFDGINLPKDKTFNEGMTQHCTTGTSPMNTVVLRGNQLKTEVPQMISYCENYYNSYADNIANSLNKLGEVAQSRVQQLSVMKESVMLEADGNAQNQNTSKTVTVVTNRGNEKKKTNGDPSITKAQWLSAISQEYSGIVLNAIRNRNFDYLKILGQLIPAKTQKEVDKNKTPQNNTIENKTKEQQETKTK